MATKIPIRKLKDTKGAYYPIAVGESILTTEDIHMANNMGIYRKGDTIPAQTALSTILKNSLEYPTPSEDPVTPQDIYDLINEYTAFEVHPTDQLISANTVDPVTNETYCVDVTPQMTELVQVRCMQPQDLQNVIIYWGDGSSMVLKDEPSKEFSQIGEGDGLCYKLEEEKEYMVYCWHTYEQPGRYIVKVFGNTYWGLRCDFDQYSLISRIFDYDLPMARWCVDICNVARGSLRLQKIFIPNYYNIRNIQNTTHSFQNCYNLVKVQNFRKLPWCSSSYAINSTFTDCCNLKSSDMKLPPCGVIPSNTNHDFYSGCINLEGDILNLLPTSGFHDKIINMKNVFRNCAKLTCSNYDSLAKLLWDDITIRWINTENCFTGCTSLDLNKIPTSWGGRKQPHKYDGVVVDNLWTIWDKIWDWIE